MQEVGEIEGAPEEGVAGLEVVEDGEVLGEEAELGEGDLAAGVVLEGELDLGEAVEEAAGDLVEEHRAVAVELRRHPDRGPGDREEGPAGRRGQRRRCRRREG